MPGLAYAQQGAGAAAPSPIVSLMPIAIMFVILYFLLIRPQQQRTREHENVIQNLKRNDEIVTSGGIYGRVQAINDNVLTLEIAPNVRIRLDRQQVASVVRAAKPDEREKDKEKA